MTFAERLRELRTEKNLTLEEVGQILGVGRSTIYKYEHGIITNVPMETYDKLSELFGVCRPYLLGWSDNRELNMSEVNMLSKDTMFLKAYTMMTDDERKRLSDLLITGYGRYQEKYGKQ